VNRWGRPSIFSGVFLFISPRLCVFYFGSTFSGWKLVELRAVDLPQSHTGDVEKSPIRWSIARSLCDSRVSRAKWRNVVNVSSCRERTTGGRRWWRTVVWVTLCRRTAPHARAHRTGTHRYRFRPTYLYLPV